MNKILLAALPFTMLLAACATTLGPFAEVDANRDGGISLDEAQRSEDLVALFNSADDDQDGVLNHEEYEIVREVILRPRETSKRSPSPSTGGGSGDGHSH